MENLVNQLITKRTERTLFLYEREKQQVTVTVEDWERDAMDFAFYLLGRGIRGKNIAVAGKNLYEWFVIARGCIISGNTAVSLNEEIEEEILRRQIAQTESVLVFLYDSRENLPDLAEKGTEIYLVTEVLPLCKGAKERYFQERGLQGSGWEHLPAYEKDNTALILFSSGTSGEPKGVMLTRGNLAATLIDDQETGFGGKSFLMSAPLYHVSGVALTLFVICHDMKVVMCANPRHLVRDVKKYRPNFLPMVPAQLDFIIFKAGRDAVLAETLACDVQWIITFGAPVVNDHEKELTEWGIARLDGYGLTETSGSVNKWWVPSKKKGIGVLRPSCSYRLVDGEFLIKGPCVMKGYFRNPEETAAVLKDGWLYTGDLMREDEDGELTIIGRKKNTIILSNGENVSPEEIEKKLGQIEEIQETMVTGRNQVVEAIVYLGEKASEEKKAAVAEKITELDKKTPSYRKIRKITFVDSPLEKTPLGKLKRY